MYTTTQVAAMLGTELRNVQNYCKRHNVPKRARDYDISEQDIEGMRAELGKPGRKRRISQIPRTKAPGLVPNSFDTPPRHRS